MPDLGLQSFNKLYPMMIRKYQDLVVDQNASEKDKINDIIQKLNALGKLSNDVVRDWNTVYNWAMNDGLNTDVSNKLEEMRANGEISQLLQNIFDSLAGSMSNLHTSAKDLLVNAINEVDDLAKANQTAITTNTANIATNTTNIATNTANIATNTANIASNTSALAQKASKTIVTYKDFGAALDGVTDDTQAVINCHNYANANNFKVVQNSGTIYLKSTATLGSPVIKTDTDLTGASILIDQTMGNNILYVVDSDQPQQTVTVTPTIQNQLIEDAIAIPALSQYEWCVFNVVSNNLLGNRNDTNNTPYYCQEPFTIGTGGALIDGALLLDYTTGTLTLTYRSILDKAITIRGAQLLINTTDKDHLAQVFSITRSNVTLTDLRIVIQSMPVNNTATYNFKNGLIQTYGVYNVTYDHFIGENPSALLASPTDTTQGQYIFTFTMSSKNKITNCHLQKNWAIMATTFIKDMVVRDSVLNVYDNHWGMSDLLIDNLRVVGNEGGIKLGWGKGTAIIQNCKTDFTNANSSIVGNAFAVGTKPDLGLIYEGEIIIRNHVVNIYEDIPSYNFFDMQLHESVTHNTTRQVKFPKLDIRNVKIDAKKVSTSISVYGVYIDIGGTSYTNANATMNKTTIKDFVLVNEQKNIRKLALYRYINALAGAINPNTLMLVDIENCGTLTKSAYNAGVPLVQIQEANTATNTKAKVRLTNVVGKLQVGDHAVVDVDARQLIGEMSRNSDPITAQFNNVTLNNCDLVTILGGVNVIAVNKTNIDTFNVDVLLTVDMHNSTVGGYLTGTGATSARYKNCIITPYQNGTYTYVQLQNMIMKHCQIIQNGSYPIALDPSTNAPLYLQGNVLNGTAKDQGTIDFLYKYIKPTYGQPSGTSVTASDVQITTTNPTTIATLTPSAQANFTVNVYYSVSTAPTNVTITVSYTDHRGAQTQTLVNVTSAGTASYLVNPIMINAKSGSPITVTATASVANNLNVSASIIQN